MKLESYIESGILELYVLDLLDEAERLAVQEMIILYPVLEQEIGNIEKTLEDYARYTGVEPSSGLRIKIEQAIAGIPAEVEPGKLLVNEHSDLQQWLNLIEARFPEALTADNFCEVWREAEGLKQVLVVSSFDIEDETHDDVYESFFILKGRCKCTVGSESFYREAGGYIGIPLNEHHQVEVIDAPVMAIVQYLSV